MRLAVAGAARGWRASAPRSVAVWHLAVGLGPAANLLDLLERLQAAGEQLDDRHDPGCLAAHLQHPLLLGRWEVDPRHDGVAERPAGLRQVLLGVAAPGCRDLLVEGQHRVGLLVAEGE